MIWLKPADLPRPVRNDYPTVADFMLADAVWTTLQNPGLNLLAANPDPEYASPKAYGDAMTAYAQMLLNAPFHSAPSGWDPVKAARAAVNIGINILAQLPVSAGDPETESVLFAWIMGTGQLAGGHPPIPATGSTGSNSETGQSAVVGPSIL